MLDLDNNRFPAALMWALPEVMQEGGAVIAEIHVSAQSMPTTSTTHGRTFELFFSVTCCVPSTNPGCAYPPTELDDKRITLDQH